MFSLFYHVKRQIDALCGKFLFEKDFFRQLGDKQFTKEGIPDLLITGKYEKGAASSSGCPSLDTVSYARLTFLLERYLRNFFHFFSFLTTRLFEGSITLDGSFGCLFHCSGCIIRVIVRGLILPSCGSIMLFTSFDLPHEE